MPVGASREAIIGFISDELARWRSRAKNGRSANETRLNAAFCSHLNVAARKGPGWDVFQFKPEEPDEINASRAYDLAAAPCVYQLVVEGRTFSDYEPILPVECKRLPTPTGKNRDPREYVYTAKGSGGGIQRYKEGKHGSVHVQAVIIGYVQAHAFSHWETTIHGWISDLHAAGVPGWSPSDALGPRVRASRHLVEYESTHDRAGLAPIRLRHLWVQM
jgi:hypothetical protein